MASWAVLTGRRLKSGAYDDWRGAWMPERMDMPAGMTAYILRKVGDPDEVIAFGMFEGSLEDLNVMRPDPAAEEARMAGMAPFVESVFADGAYEVVEVVQG
ncbi:MAG TPA: hypothetical protein VI540_08195 [Gaiellaceae bacterium]|nr:hypothetical protein [Gaiellaceae bacterium]